LSYLNGEINDATLFNVISKYMWGIAPTTGKFKLIKMIDTFKYFENYKDDKLKQYLSVELEKYSGQNI
jgi:hypothetical protein